MAEPMTSPRSTRPIPTWYYAAGAGVVVLGYVVYKRSKTNAANAATTAAATPAASTASTVGTAAGSYGQDYSGEFANIEQQLASLQASQAATTGAAASSGVTTTGYTPPTNVALSGSGYKTSGSGTITASNGHTYAQFPGYPQAQAFLKSGGKIYYQPLPGVFTELKGLSEAPNTYYYSQVS